MAVVIRSIVRERSQGERILVQVCRIVNQVDDKVAAPNVMQQIAEKLAAERTIAHVLNDASAISIGVRLFQVGRCGFGEAAQKQTLDGGVPNRVDNRFMSENGIGRRGGSREQNQQAQTEGGSNFQELANLGHGNTFTFCANIMPAPPKIITPLKSGDTFSSLWVSIPIETPPA